MTNTVIIGIYADADGSFTLPADLTGTLKIEIWQRGGAGGANAGGGGGSGAYSRRDAKTVSPLDTISWTNDNTDLVCDSMTASIGGDGGTGVFGSAGSAGSSSGGNTNTAGSAGSAGGATAGGNGANAPASGGAGGAGGASDTYGGNGGEPGAGGGGGGIDLGSGGFGGSYGRPIIKFTFEITGDSYEIPPENTNGFIYKDVSSSLLVEAWGTSGAGEDTTEEGGGGGGGGGAYAEMDLDISSYDYVIFQIALGSGSSLITPDMSTTLFYADTGLDANGNTGGAGGLAANCVSDSAIDGDDGSNSSGDTGGAGGDAANSGGTGGAGGTVGNPGTNGNYPGGGGGGTGAGAGDGGNAAMGKIIINFPAGATGNPWNYYAQQ